jgi:undecaprenyl-diphosphatase
MVYFLLLLRTETKEERHKSIVLRIYPIKLHYILGLFQVLSLVPGTSRSGATILGAIILGTSRYIAAEYSFFLAIPVMFGASALKLIKFGF